MITLRYPANIPTLILELRNPTLGDINRWNPRMILNQSRAGDQIISKPANRPSRHTKSWQFTTLTATKRDGLINFLITSSADLVNITDQNGDVYDALITNSTPTFITNRDECSYSVTLDLVIPTGQVSPSPSPSPSP